MEDNILILKLSCPDAIGLLARITGFVAGVRGNLVEVHQYTDPSAGWFFSRLVFQAAPGMTPGEFREGFQALGTELGAEWSVREAGHRARMVVLVSREEHCLAELLWRRRSGDLPVEIPVVIGNHDCCAEMARAEGIEFVRIETPGRDREETFRRIFALCGDLGAEVIVLARFMQILPAWFCERYSGRIINIHHSFLPAFPGADPYRRAFERGVKLIGATCHYATEELDAGPIIEQEVVRVEHFHEVEDLKRHGRDCERLALARGVRFHVEDRVLIHGPRAVVFRD